MGPPPKVVLEVRERVRLYLDLLEDKQAWQHRIHATLFQHGVPKVDGRLLAGGRAEHGRDDPDLSDAGRDAVDTALRIIAALDADLTRIRAELVAFGRAHPGPRELAHEYGLARALATAVWEELGDTRRFTSSRQAVRHAGLDISVYDSDGKHKGRPTLTRQGPPALRWALYEGAVHAHKTTSPDHAYYTRLARRAGSGLGTAGGGPQARPSLPPPAARPGDQAWVESPGSPPVVMVTVSANQPATEDTTGRCGQLPDWHCSPAESWTTFNRSSGRTPHLPAGHPINPPVTGRSARPRTKVSLGACGTPPSRGPRTRQPRRSP